jgi:4-hydroxy-4-methyl-2-oxoglutarate aldolase
MTERVSPDTLAALRRLDTCEVANAIETFGLRLRNEGFANRTIRCFTSRLPPVVGYAETLRVRSSSPPTERHSYFDRTDWWSDLKALPHPRILVIEDVDPQVGVGAFVGGVHAHVLRALGCVAAITNGAVRDIPEVTDAGLHLFAGNLSPSHAYVHVVEYGRPVKLAGLSVAPGELLHLDQHGVVSVPEEIAHEIPAAADRLRDRETQIVDFCHSAAFSVEGLRALIAAQS